MSGVSRYRLLFVDDDEHLQRSYRRVAQAEGHEVVQSFDGDSILELARAERPDLIVLDINLPSFDGRDILKQLKGSAETASIPVLICSARTGHFDRLVGLELGALDYVEKPCSGGELMRRIARMIEKTRAAD